LLLEGAGTNLVTYSEEFDNAAWNFAGCLAFGSGSTANAITAPDGTLTADLITQDSATSLHSANRTAAFAVTAGQAYTLSVFLKANGAEWVFLQLNGNIWTETGDRPRFWFNLSTGEEGSSDRNSGVGLTNFGDGWYRAHITATASTNANTNLAIAMTVADSNNSTFAGDGTSGIYLWGAQVEQSSYPTSYIPTSGSTATRAADVSTSAATFGNSWYEQDEGTVFSEVSIGSRKGAVSFVQFQDATATDRIQLRQNSGGTSILAQVVDGSSGSLGLATTAFTVGLTYKLALGVKAGDHAASIDGSVASGSTVPNTMPTVDQITFTPTSPVVAGVSTIRRLTYWPTRLSNDTLQTITT